MKIQYSEFKGPAMIVMGGGKKVTKIAPKKIKPTFSICSARFSSPIEGPVMIAMGRRACGWLANENHD